jgi:hypothetical protein
MQTSSDWGIPLQRGCRGERGLSGDMDCEAHSAVDCDSINERAKWREANHLYG